MADKPLRKIFCIGLNKTGTTSLAKFMELNGFSCGDQKSGELLLQKYRAGEYDDFFAHCNSAEFFQDIPFSIPGCHRVLMAEFPDAKFILTLRQSAEEWFRSLLAFHEKVFGTPLDKNQLQKANYRYTGFAWEANRLLYSSPETEPYQKDKLISDYELHKDQVIADFSESDNLLVLNIEENNAPKKLADFLKIQLVSPEMPWLNKTSEL